jgi:hypothetical protein
LDRTALHNKYQQARIKLSGVIFCSIDPGNSPIIPVPVLVVATFAATFGAPFFPLFLPCTCTYPNSKLFM